MEKKNPNLFEKSTELISGFQIFLSPFLIGAIISAIIYFLNPNTVTVVIAVLILILGAIIGIKLAYKIYRSKEGTVDFISKTDSSPEIDKFLNKEK